MVSKQNQHARLRRIFDLCQKFSLIHLDSKSDKLSGCTKNYLRFTNPFLLTTRQKGSKKLTIPFRLLPLLILVFSIYFFIKNVILITLYFRRDLLLVNWRPLIKFTNRSCDSLAEITFYSERDKDKYQDVEYLTKFLYKKADCMTLMIRGSTIQAYVLHVRMHYSYLYWMIYDVDGQEFV